MSANAPATFETFEPALRALVARFSAGAAGFLSRQYDEASLRQDFLNPLFRALGWDLENTARLILKHREVEIESRTMIVGRKKRADYLFRTDTRDRFVCEAKKPFETLDSRCAFQAKRYGWNKEVPLALLSDFEELCIYIVAARPSLDDSVEVGLWKKWHHAEYPAHAREIWDLLSRDAVAGGSIDRLLDTLPKKPSSKGRARQLWLIRPDRSRALDTDFLNFLDEARRTLGSDLLRHNPASGLREDHARLNEAVQCILDRLLFLRICEDRDIDTGTNLHLEVENWRSATGRPSPSRARQSFLPAIGEEPPPPSGAPTLSTRLLWPSLVDHFRALDRRPASHVPYFNGHLFKPHFIEDLTVGDDWLATFLDDLSSDESPYLFAIIPVEILGTIYERFLGKVIRPQGLGVTIEEKPEVRKAGGVYYTPRYIVDYIVEQTVGKLLADQPPEKTLTLRFLDPACGSGSFLLRVFERVCEHWLIWLTANPKARRKNLCWTDAATGDVHLTAALKRRILTANIYGVDLDPGAVEVTQLSLYLKMLENENRNTLARERELFADEDEPALLPPLAANIKCGNSLIASDFSLDPDELVRVRAFDWAVQFAAIMKAGGFDAVVGNPPYRMLQPHNTEKSELEYLRTHYVSADFKIELFHLFLQRGTSLVSSLGRSGFIVPTTLLNNVYAEKLRRWLLDNCKIQSISVSRERVFADADVHTSVLIFERSNKSATRDSNLINTTTDLTPAFVTTPIFTGTTRQSRFFGMPGCVWNVLLTEANAGLIERLQSKFPPLKSVAKINRGLITGDRAKYFSGRKETARHVPILAGGDVDRYAVTPPSEFVLFVRPDSAGGCWDEAVHLSPHKLVIRQIGTKPTASILEKPIAVTGNLFTIIADSVAQEKFILGIINSKLIEFFWQVMFADFKNSFPQVTIFSLAQVPLHHNAEARTKTRLVALVDKMLALAPKLRAATGDHERATLQNAVTATDHQIDQLVYELYNLTPEEIALVENLPASGAGTTRA